jgi:hypothetical protein
VRWCESSWVVFFLSKEKNPWRRRQRMMAEEEAAEDSHDHSSCASYHSVRDQVFMMIMQPE